MDSTKRNKIEAVNVNAHLHTPYSFSAFDKLTDALDRAVAENVRVVGVNDFYSMDGYKEWNDGCRSRKLFPLFNIEFISLQQQDQAAGVRVNDPNNPGRTYLSGKGLAYPVELAEPYASQLAAVRAESNAQVETMCGKLNDVLRSYDAGFELDFKEIERTLTKGSIRERHLAKALRLAAYEHLKNEPKAIAAFFEKIFGGKPLKSDVADHAAVENEIRGNLLKAGGAAFVPEDPKAFLPMETVRKIILAAGGIPTYPFLADDAKGGFTDFEQDVVKTAETLRERGIFSVEFITTRNSVEVLEKYAGYLHDNGFVIDVRLGAQYARDGADRAFRPGRSSPDRAAQVHQLLRRMRVVAAHQDIVASGMQGYVDSRGKADIDKRDEYIKHGDSVIKAAIR